jgi:hypothetical protein
MKQPIGGSDWTHAVNIDIGVEKNGKHWFTLEMGMCTSGKTRVHFHQHLDSKV